MAKYHYSLLAAAALTLGFASAASAAAIDLNTWSEISPASNGTWTVSGDGSSVFQSINGNPTYFVSPDSFINNSFSGSFGVEGDAGDDDWIGFVFGLQDANEFWLFDWKQTNQNNGGLAYEGFTLSYVTGGAGAIPFGLHDTSDTGYDVVDTDYSTTNGWVDRTVYDFTLTYQENRIRIDVDGTNIFDILNSDLAVPSAALDGGLFQAGRFGFYNFSQQNVRYAGFEEDVAPPTDPTGVPEPATLALLGSGLLGIGIMRRRKKA